MNAEPATTEVRLRASRWKNLLFLVLSLGFVLGGALMLKTGHSVLLGWLGIVFFGLCFLAFFVNLLPGSSYLLLDEDGIEYASLFRKHRIPWTDLNGEFGVVNISHNKMPAFNFTEPKASEKGARGSRSLCGFDGALHDTFGMKAEELAELLGKIWGVMDERRNSMHSSDSVVPNKT